MEVLNRIKDLLEEKGKIYTGTSINEMRVILDGLVGAMLPQTKLSSVSEEDLALVINAMAVDVLKTTKSNGDNTLVYSPTTKNSYNTKISSELKNLQLARVNSWINGSVPVFGPMLKGAYDNGLISKNHMYTYFKILAAMLLDGLKDSELDAMEKHLSTVYMSGSSDGNEEPEDELEYENKFFVHRNIDPNEDTTGFSADMLFWRQSTLDNEKEMKRVNANKIKYGLAV